MPDAGVGAWRKSDRRDGLFRRRTGQICPRRLEEVTWKRFREEITAGYGGDNLAVRRKFVAKELQVVALLKSKGVEFLAGTDTPAGVYVFPGFSLHQELQRFVDAGFSPLDALRTATLNPARFFGVEERYGTVEAGRAADLVMVRGNPLREIANTRKIAAMMINGRYLSRMDLDQMLAGVENAAKETGLAN